MEWIFSGISIAIILLILERIKNYKWSKPRLLLYYHINKGGPYRLSGGPLRREFTIILGIENKSKHKSASNINLNVSNLPDYLSFKNINTDLQDINPKDKIDVLISNALRIVEDSKKFDDIVFDYKVSSLDTKTVYKKIIISGKEIIDKVLKT